MNHYYRVFAGPAVGQKVAGSSKGKGFVGLTYYDGSAWFYSAKPIQSPEDLKGMKIRVQPSPTAVEMRLN